MRTRRRTILIICFAAVLVGTVAIGARLVARTVYWSMHREEPIESWMTVGYVAHSYDVPPETLQAAVGLDPGRRDRRTIAEIAKANGRSEPEVKAALLAAIADARSSGGGEPPP